MKTKIVLLVGVVFAALWLSACGKKEPVVTAQSPVVTGIKAEAVAVSPMEDFYEATGTVKSRTTTTVSARTMGTVVALRVREGDRVSAGQTLVEIDNRDAATQVRKAQAGLTEAQAAQNEVEQSINSAQSAKAAAEANKRLAETTYKRYQILLERKSVSPQEFDEVKAKFQIASAEVERAEKMVQVLTAKRSGVAARIEQARAEIAGAQVQAGYARITAPISGIVIAKSIEVGATAMPGAPLLTIEDGSHYRLEAGVEESQLRRVKLRGEARVRIDALGGELLPATVGEIVPAADPSSRTYTVKLDLPAQPLLRSGLYGTAQFASGERQGITIPQGALVQRGQLTGVFVVDKENVARFRIVKSGKASGERIEILSGVQAGERVVTVGAARVNDGNRVQ